jgi:hypothetical protein
MQLFADLDAKKALELGAIGALGHARQRIEEELPRVASDAGHVALH